MKKFLYTSLLLTILFAGCGPAEKKDDDGKLFVVTTIGMIADTAAEIGGERVDAVALMGPGVDPHLYKASAGDVDRLQKADLILFNGLHLEARMGDMLEKISANRPVVAVGESLDESKLISDESFGGTHDPHIWFDVSNWMVVADTITEALVKADPEGKDTYEANSAAYRSKLEELDQYVRDTISSIDEHQRVLITAHDAFHYFGRAYGMEVRGLQGISTVTEAGAKDVQNLADYIAGKKIRAIFIESSVPKKNIEALQAAVQNRGFDVQIGGELYSDAMGAEGTFEGTYIGMVTHNADTIAKALQGEE